MRWSFVQSIAIEINKQGGNNYMKKTILALAMASALAVVPEASAVIINASGNLASANEVDIVMFDVTQSSLVTIETTSYTAGSFDPILSLWDKVTGVILDVDDDDGEGFDAKISMVLPAGWYSIGVSSFSNQPSGGIGGNISDGYNDSGSDTGDWALFIEGDHIARTGVPEGGSSLLMGVLAIGALAGTRRFFGRRAWLSTTPRLPI
jgi:hypothetical protein